jgi:hypothetical protein
MALIQIDEGVAAVIGAIAGLIGGFVIAGLNYRQKADELFFKALDYLGGGSQKRILGISAIELYWRKRRHRNVCIHLLCGSSIYLLRESGQDDAEHERYNLDRMMNLLLQTRVEGDLKPSYIALRDSVKKAVEAAPNRPKSTKGLDVSESKLRGWEAKLDQLLQ